jgi:hypothetical protein
MRRCGGTTDTKYMLNNAKAKKGPDDTTGQATEPQDASRYRLDAEDGRLAPENGHQVEIVTIVEAPESPTPAGTTGSTDTSKASANAPKLKVETIKTIAVTCAQ